MLPAAAVAAIAVWSLLVTGCFVGGWFGGGGPAPVAYISTDGDRARVLILNPGDREPVDVSLREANARSLSWAPGADASGLGSRAGKCRC